MFEKITILIPSYNNGSKLFRCLDSVYKQTYKNIKVILLDDCSTDNTEEIVNSFRDRLDILYVRNENNLGRGASRNKIISLSETRISCWLDSDDYMHEEKIEKQYEFFSKNSNCKFLATPMYDTRLNEMLLGNSNYEKIKNVTLENLKIVNHIPHPTVMFVTEIAKKIGFNTTLNRNEDLDFYIRLYESGYKVDVIPDILYYYCY
jgi:glycosyltransferase involved in cell wall biosynthesis